MPPPVQPSTKLLTSPWCTLLVVIRPTQNMQELLESEAPEALQEWAAKLPTTVREIAAHWDFTLESPFEPGGQCGSSQLRV